MSPNPETERQLAGRLEHLAERIALAAGRCGRDPEAVRLIAVSKAASPAAMLAAARLGLPHMGENRVQDALPRMAAAGEAGWRPHWHLIGHLQRNKAAAAAQAFDSIDSVDSLDLAWALSRHSARLGRHLAVLLQAKIMPDPGKFGLEPAALVDVAGAVAALPGLRLDGLMGILPLGMERMDQRRAFAALATLLDRVRASLPDVPLPRLSMGMTEDFEPAIELGATEVRVGRLLFESL